MQNTQRTKQENLMFIKHIAWLRCVNCGGDLFLKAGEPASEQIDNGVLCCRSCQQLFPVLDGAAVLFSRSSHHTLSAPEMARIAQYQFPLADFGFTRRTKNKKERQQLAVETNWEYQWEKLHPFTVKDLSGKGLYGLEAFKNFIPLEQAEIAGATVLVGGAGRGREAYHLAKMGAKTIIAVDLGREVLASKSLLPPDSTTELLLLRSDLVELPLKDEVVHIAICDHALQHVHNHQAGFTELVRVTRQSGKIAICVYSWEANIIMTHMVEPLKFFLHKVPLPILFFLSLFPGLILQLIIMSVYVPAAKISPRLLSKLPLPEHMMFWSQNSFKTNRMAIFDLFHAPISYHFKRQEIENLAKNNQLHSEYIRHTNGVLWSLVATKPATGRCHQTL